MTACRRQAKASLKAIDRRPGRRRHTRTEPALACLVLAALLLAGCTAPGSVARDTGGGQGARPGQDPPSPTGVVIRHVSSGAAFTLDLADVASVSGSSGSVSGDGTVSLAPVPAVAAPRGVAAVGHGTQVAFDGMAPSQDVTIKLAPPPVPAGRVTATWTTGRPQASTAGLSRTSLFPIMIHRLDDGSLTLESADQDADGWFTLRTRSFSPRWPAWLDPRPWLSSVVDSVTDSLAGRTDPLPCPNDGPPWATLEKKTTMVHTCLRTNVDGKGVVRAEAGLQSNRRFWLKASIPQGAGYVWVQDSDTLVSALLARARRGGPGDRIIPGQGRLTAGFYRPQESQQLRFTAYQDGESALLSLASSVITTLTGAVAGDKRNGIASAWALWSCRDEIPRDPGDADGWWHVATCIFADAIPQLANPRQALSGAVDLKGVPLTDGDVTQVSQLASKLKLVGQGFKVAGLAFLVRDIWQQIPDAFSAMGSDRTGDVDLRLSGSNPATAVKTFNAVTAGGRLAQGFSWDSPKAGQYCSPGSGTVEYGYRCSSGDTLYDPCWRLSAADSPTVVCADDPWARRLTPLHVSDLPQLRLAGDRDLAWPWAYALSSGAHCVNSSGAHDQYQGKVVGAQCNDGTSVWGPINETSPTWKVDLLRNTSGSGPRYREAGSATVTEAWFGPRP